jgi:hypothetical protein
MYLQHRFKLALLASLASVALATTARAQTPGGLITGFEPSGSPGEVTNPAGYTTGSLLFQDNWQGGTVFPRVQTAEEISTELTAAGLNPANPVHSGTQALLAVKGDTNVESTGYFVRDIFTGLESANKVVVSFWARPLTSGLGADPAGTPAGNGKTIGERQGNTFVGIMDSNNETRAAAVRFGVDTSGSNPYTNVLERHIDWGSASAGSAVWVKSGLLWTADAWYNFKFDMDYTTKKYDFYVNGVKANQDPIRFYNEASQNATRFFVSRGTNQAGQIIDDISVTEKSVTSGGDFNHDGRIDGADFILWQQDNSVGNLSTFLANFGASASAAASAVPEPATATIALALAALCVRRRKS